MRVFVSADIEGVTGVTTWDQCGGPASSRFDFVFARQMMAHDVNSAIRGAKAAGAELVVVKDSHGNSKNLTADLLVGGAQLVSGVGCGPIDGMMQGIDGTFDACVLVGYHAMAGTPRAVMEHTMSGQVHRLWFNGREIGEIGLSAGLAGRYGVPVVAVTSDEAGCAEARALVPEVATAAVKEGYGRYMARCLPPEATGPLIEAAVRDGLERRSEIAPVVFDGPVEVRVEFNRAESADLCERLPGVRRVDGYTVAADCPDFAAAHRLFRNLCIFGGEGIQSLH
ncbi:MAG: M55 family metallopeptidase [Fimbriimonadales bacterium]|nr:M55 family metallopeptidase [Fimbriimonadales bacterium]